MFAYFGLSLQKSLDYASIGSLPPNNIRLLQLQPSKEHESPLQGLMFEYSLRDQSACPYEALSYVWGSEETPNVISINGSSQLAITRNLDSALRSLRFDVFPRLLWIDAICINQADRLEKEKQIPLMPEIYAKAQQVLVWLGEAAEDSHEALESIRHLSEERAKVSANSTAPAEDEEYKISLDRFWNDIATHKDAIGALFRRSWFRRVWVLQEMAAARHITVICGTTILDGHAFSVGAAYLDAEFGIKPPVVFLMRGAVFRSRSIFRTLSFASSYDRIPLGMQTLGRLLDMYAGHEATKSHDKLYALLGMCSHSLNRAGIEVDYTVSIETLMLCMSKFLFKDATSIEWLGDLNIGISIPVAVLGIVTAAEYLGGENGEQVLDITFEEKLQFVSSFPRWVLPQTATSIKNGDILCIVQGRSSPSILRSCERHLALVSIEARLEALPISSSGQGTFTIDWTDANYRIHTTLDLPLVWDWNLNALIRGGDSYCEDSTDGMGMMIWTIACILKKAGARRAAKNILYNAGERYHAILGHSRTYVLDSVSGLTRLDWAAGYGDEDAVMQILEDDKFSTLAQGSEYYEAPIQTAAENGQNSILRLLLFKSRGEQKNPYRSTAIVLGMQYGYYEIVDTLLADVASRQVPYKNPASLLWFATYYGHMGVLKSILEDDINIIGLYSSHVQSSLSLAAKSGRAEVMEFFIERVVAFRRGPDGERFDDYISFDKLDAQDMTPLMWAASGGHHEIVKMLLATNEVRVNKANSEELTPLMLAAQGHEKVVQILLSAKGIDVNVAQSSGKTALWFAAKHGDHDIVRLLLTKANPQITPEQPTEHNAPLLAAVSQRNEAVVRLLLRTPDINVEVRDSTGRTPLSLMTHAGDEAICEMLLRVGDANIETRDREKKTPLWFAVQNNALGIVKLLLDIGKADVWARPHDPNKNPLEFARNLASRDIFPVLEEYANVALELRTKKLC